MALTQRPCAGGQRSLLVRLSLRDDFLRCCGLVPYRHGNRSHFVPRLLSFPLAPSRNTACPSRLDLAAGRSASRNRVDQNRNATAVEALALRTHFVLRSLRSFSCRFL